MKPTIDRESRNARDVALVMRIREGDKQAADELIALYQNLIYKVALGYAGSVQKHDPASALDDLLQEATLGLMRATLTYDAARGKTFLGYAHLWIKSFVQRYYDKCGLIPKIQDKTPRKSASGAKNLELHQMQTKMAELDQPLRHNSEATLGDVLSNKNQRGVEDTVVTRLYLMALIEASKLSPNQREAVDIYLTGECDSGREAAIRAGLWASNWGHIMDKMRATAQAIGGD